MHVRKCGQFIGHLPSLGHTPKHTRSYVSDNVAMLPHMDEDHITHSHACEEMQTFHWLATWMKNMQPSCERRKQKNKKKKIFRRKMSLF